MPNASMPERLYKYRSFSKHTLDLLIKDRLFFANPIDFNDPLDTKPALEIDVPTKELVEMLRKMAKERTRLEKTRAASSIKYKGPGTLDHIAKISEQAAADIIADIEYHAIDVDLQEGEDRASAEANRLAHLLRRKIEEELLLRYDRGIFSLAERADCPLMWSHYGEQHRGICVGYSVPQDHPDFLLRVQYGGSRRVKASDIAAMLEGDKEAQGRVDSGVLASKAQEWQYEREWRLIGERGDRDCPLELEEIVFGLRCDIAVQFIIVKAMYERRRPVKFFEVRENRASFNLYVDNLEIDELLHHFPMRHREVLEWFSSSE